MKTRITIVLAMLLVTFINLAGQVIDKAQQEFYNAYNFSKMQS